MARLPIPARTSPTISAEPASALGSPLERHQLLIRDLDRNGHGVGAMADGSVAFVPGALMGEEVEVRVLHRGQRHVQTQLTRLLLPSPERRPAPCPVAERCGGCQLQHLNGKGQRQWKQQHLAAALGRIGRLDTAAVAPIVHGEQSLGYRNKAVIPLASRNGTTVMGFYAAGSHEVVPITSCSVLEPRLNRLLEPLLNDLRQQGWPVASGGAGQPTGLRHLALRLGSNCGEVLLTLISANPRLPGLEACAERWLQRWDDLVGVCLNHQPQPTNRLFGPESRCVAGRPWIVERFAGLLFHLGPRSFFQINTAMAEALIPRLAQALQVNRSTHLIDAYCGIGTFTLPLATRAAQVVGLEAFKPALEDARNSARLNRIHNVDFRSGTVAEQLPALLPYGDALLLDPPRKGLEAATAVAIREQPPQRLAYLSCHPASLARDLKILLEGNLEIEQVIPLDFFPQTTHVESLAVLRRVGDR